jgi:hypothetical protein
MKLSVIGGMKPRRTTLGCVAFAGLVAAVLALASGDRPNVAASPELKMVKDGGFEAGPNGGFWDQKSTNYPLLICSVAACGNGSSGGSGPTALPRSGVYWAWFGGCTPDTCTEPTEVGVLKQRARFPSGSAILRFYLWIGSRSEDGNGKLQVLIDGQRVFKVKETKTRYHNSYRLVEIDVSQFADGGRHLVVFKSKTFRSDTASNISVDDVGIQ